MYSKPFNHSSDWSQSLALITTKLHKKLIEQTNSDPELVINYSLSPEILESCVIVFSSANNLSNIKEVKFLLVQAVMGIILSHARLPYCICLDTAKETCDDLMFAVELDNQRRQKARNKKRDEMRARYLEKYPERLWL